MQAAPGAPAPQPAYNPYGDIKADPYGGESNYVATVKFEQAEDELKKIHDDIFQNNSAGLLKKDPFKDLIPIEQTRLGAPLSANGSPGYLDQYEILPQAVPTNEEKSGTKVDDLTEKYKKAFLSSSLIAQPKQVKVYNMQSGATLKPVTSSNVFGQSPHIQSTLRPQKSFGTDTSLQVSRQSSIRSNA